MATDVALHRVLGDPISWRDEQPLADVVFVHGLGHDGFRTWQPTVISGRFWPTWIAGPYTQVQVWTVSYPALSTRWSRDESQEGMLRVARDLLAALAARQVGDRPIVFVAHCLGGLIVKELLRAAESAEDPAQRHVSEMTRGVVFLSTPHTAAALARLETAVAKLHPDSRPLPDLGATSDYFGELNDWFVQYANPAKLRVKASYETHALDDTGQVVVEKLDANPFPGRPGFEPNDMWGDHFSTCRTNIIDGELTDYVRRFVTSLTGSWEWSLNVVWTQHLTEEARPFMYRMLKLPGLWPCSNTEMGDAQKFLDQFTIWGMGPRNRGSVTVFVLRDFMSKTRLEHRPVGKLFGHIEHTFSTAHVAPVVVFYGTDAELGRFKSSLIPSARACLERLASFTLHSVDEASYDLSNRHDILTRRMRDLREQIRAHWAFLPTPLMPLR